MTSQTRTTNNGKELFTVIKGKTVLALAGCDVDSRYIDTLILSVDPTEDALRAENAKIQHDWLVLVRSNPEAVDACIERAQLGHGCVSTTMNKPNGAICVATKEWLGEHEFSHAGLTKHETC